MGTWFSQIIQASYDFIIDERVTWVEIKGIPFKLWSGNTFSRIASRWVDLLDGDDQEDGYYHSKIICISTKLKANLFESFKVVYRGLEEDSDVEEVPETKFGEEPNKPTVEEGDSLKYSPGFTPRDNKDASVVGQFRKSEVPRTGGSILQLIDDLVKDPNMFKKLNDTVSDYFIMVRGVWEGEVVIKSDFNEVDAHLLGVIKSVTKMSKLDRFLISDSLMRSCPNISSTSLDRYLSDHRLILMCEIIQDYGLVPFRLNKESLNSGKRSLKAELINLDVLIDKGDGEATHINRRYEVVGLLQEVEKIESMEVAQKPKIKCANEGDENSKYYHVRWDFVDDILTKFDFGEKWCRVVDASMLKGIVLAHSLHLSHMFYADDAIFMDAVKLEQAAAKIGCFFNGVDPYSKKPIWVKWKNALASKDKGGLGVSSLFALNRGLLFKWVWHFISQSSSLWARVIKALHGEDGKIGKKVKSTYPSLWLNIIHEVELLKLRGIDLLSFIHSKLGNGVNTSFWDVAWCGGTAFKVLYPRMYALELIKSIDVASKMSHSGLEYSFRRNPRGGVEQVQFNRLQEKVEGCVLINMNDRWVWSLEGSGVFLVASVRKLIDDALLPGVNTKTRWIKAVPIKINVHAWKVKLDCLPTRLNISRRGMNIESILCPMCGKAVESSRHLFFTCRLTSEIMSKISRLWDIGYMEITSYEEWLDWITNLRMSLKHKRIFEGICYVLWWYIWSRNKGIFGRESPPKASILDDVVSHSFYWCRSRCKASFSWIEWLKNPHLISL
nr:RNA-directed DNA polymerase, eukaryota, reverse transcriptase zinc-binding domain protein [Tanacetum cinerariifolium]